jgi:FxsC-like protein
MTPLFFVSYARSDRDSYLEQFVLDLTEEVRRKLGEKRNENIRFWDTQDIDVGDVWPEKLRDALRVSRFCVCLLSPGYFNSEYCGKEFQVFKLRQSLNKRFSGTRPIFPVLWEAPRGPLPDAVQSLQYTTDDFPVTYVDEGLRYLMKLSKHKDDYLLFVDRLAAKLVEAGDTEPLPELEVLDSLSNVASAFRFSNNVENDEGGPSNVRFVFVAASQSEIRSLRTELGPYSRHGGWYWQPYYPAVETCAGKVAQLTATQLDFRYNELSVDVDLVERLKRSEERNEVVVVLADPWTVRLPRYADLMRQYDSVTLVNCSVLILWNDKDCETNDQRQMLQHGLSNVFRRKFILRPPAHEWDSIRSPKDLSTKLAEVLEKLRMMVLQLGTAGRKAESSTIVEEARRAGVPIIDKPTLATPTAEG